MIDEKLIEEKIQRKGLKYPRLTPKDIEELIMSKTYTILPSGKVMICEITLKNGFSVRGEAATVCKENFDEEIGREISYNKARDKIWQLEGYLLQEYLFTHSK